ncbi:MAG TPA: tRNA (N(6)-L-threonylcarbamoyladenosine(37)-C(2))-methylthiotransferase MtaB [Candidatus Acidoferrales bacterium]|nr:tRNA (N(6)-L-threonylcarbamoyladenosine(37)-C(2))-methylthiotransferase MtaB [Candidatus Acidoferrales bacterium]
MSTFTIHNFGCRATQADAASIRQSFLARGYSLAETDSVADLVLLNTCTVTAAADAEARDAIRRIHRQNPCARIVVTGCYAQRAPEELAAIDGVSWVIGNSHQTEIPSLVNDKRLVSIEGLAQHGSLPAQIVREEMRAARDLAVVPPEDVLGERTRPTLKIQDGCNHRCAYCVIPFVRGRSRSLSPDRVLFNVRRLVDSGAQEIVLSGIDLGSYGRDLNPRMHLYDLIQRILNESVIQRLRLSSIEPMDVTQDFVDLASSTERIAPHFHMPLQSGSDRVLHSMHRWYRAAHYARRVEIIHERLPHAAIGADVIAGFPGETEEEHRVTMDFIEGLPLAYLHVFAFSAREGTEAGKLVETVHESAIHRRARELRALGEARAKAFRASQKGRTLRVLTLDRKNRDWTPAISGNFLKVKLAGLWSRNRWMNIIFDESDAPLMPQHVEA